MILLELKQYIESHPGCSRRELATEFAISEDGVDAMLWIWITRGMLSRHADINAAQHVVRVRYRFNSCQCLAVNVTL